MASASHTQVIIYTTPTCPDCWALRTWLAQEGVAFEERDLSDPAIMAEAKARTGVRVAGPLPAPWQREMTKRVDIRQTLESLCCRTTPDGRS